jgi:hypothetical protein
MMNCEEFEMRGLDLDRADADPKEVANAARHVQVCARCSAMLESWREVKNDLRLLGKATQVNSAPARVEMRLRQELRTSREARVPLSKVMTAAWTLAAVAVLAAGLGWKQWHDNRTNIGSKANARSSAGAATAGVADGSHATATERDAAMLLADYDSGAFTQLPGSLPSPYESQAILQVRMQRGALGRFGLPVAQDRATEWVKVDFLIGEDGLPQAVRLHQDLQAGTLQ